MSRGIPLGWCWAMIMAAWVALGAGPDDLFVAAYGLIQQADHQREVGQRADAVETFAKAQQELQKIQRIYPSWNETVIQYRLRYVGSALETLRAPGRVPVVEAAPAGAPDTQLVGQWTQLNDRIREIYQDRSLLEARLREALSAQPAPLDPRELEKAVERITHLQSTNRALVKQLEEFRTERRTLVERVVFDETQRALEAANQELMARKRASAAMIQEKERIEGELKSLRDGELKGLKVENAALKTQVGELRSETERGRQVVELTTRLSRLQASLEESQARNQQLTKEKALLELRLGDAQVRRIEESTQRISRLETELAVARADAGRNADRAEQLTAALEQEKAVRAGSEQQRKQLGERVEALVRENAATAAAVRTLQEALSAARADRVKLEQDLKLAEERLMIARRPGGGAGPSGAVPAEVASAESAVRVTVLESEAQKLRSGLRESRDREAELHVTLLEERRVRERLEAEKRDLEVKLAAILGGPSGSTDPARVAALEQRVRQLEADRAGMLARLNQAGQRVAAPGRGRAITPRDSIVEFRLSR